ncbi:MAG: hypothetical protein SFU86_00780 [Pirellulaceae bacterium]|nr:hypothetical protein [Pirellulaceae bacterium]
MMRGLSLVIMLFVAVGLAGCGGGGSQPIAGGNGQPERQPVAVPASATPDQVVSVFLGALRSGDKPTTAHLLTTKAREETAKHGWAVDPKGSPNTKYEIHAAEILPDNPNGSHVTSVWTETFDDGTITYQIVWVLRKETPGWRIAGMALELVPGQPPAFLNFEDPADMERKQQEAIAAAEKQAAIETAQVPPAPQDPQSIAPAAPGSLPPSLPPSSFPADPNGTAAPTDPGAFAPAPGTFAPSTQPTTAPPGPNFIPAAPGFAPPTISPPAPIER